MRMHLPLTYRWCIAALVLLYGCLFGSLLSGRVGFVAVSADQELRRVTEMDWRSGDEKVYREKVEEMFFHTYDAYMNYAFPMDEIRPMTCKGVDTLGGYSVTLIDSLDTLAVLGDCEELWKQMEWVAEIPDFAIDRNVSVFETNIRMVGGLLGAHFVTGEESACGRKQKSDLIGEKNRQADGLEASGDPDSKEDLVWEKRLQWREKVLYLATDLAERLLLAFDTSTKMPYGTVNLKYGIPNAETPITASAGVGTFAVEWEYLSAVTGRKEFAMAAREAVEALYSHRTHYGLVGTHIDTQSGKWVTRSGGIGSYVDSYIEYLVKGWIMTQEPVYGSKYASTYAAAMGILYDKQR